MNSLSNLFSFTEASWLLLTGLLSVVLLLYLLIPYFLLRADAAARGDHQLGLKVLFHFSFSVCVLAGILGLTLVVRGYLGAFFGDTRNGSSTSEVGWYLSIASAVLAVMYACSVHLGTNHNIFPATGRVYTLGR